MKNFSSAMTRHRKWIVGAKAALVLLFVGVATVSALTVMPVTTCPTNLNSCTASDLVTAVSDALPVGGDTCTDPGDTITVDLYVAWTPNANVRYDVGFYISTDGDPVNNNDACVGSIAPIGEGETPPGNQFKNLDGQSGDLCGDVSAAAPVTWAVRTTVPCKPDANNNLQVEACRVWDNNIGIVCTNLADSGTGSKCDCSPLIVTQIPVPEAATVTVVKDLIPVSDPGTVNLWIDEGNDGTNDHEVTNVGDGGTVGPHTVPAGTTANPGATHNVGETAYTGTDLSHYDTSITCVKVGGGTVGPVLATSTNLTVQPNDNWTCTITNIKRADWGDLPDGTQFGLPGFVWSADYKTLLADNGPSHVILYPDTDADNKPNQGTGVTPAIWLGATIDAEVDGAPTDSANGDDIAGPAPDDEDGIALFYPEYWQAGVPNGGALNATFSSSSTTGAGCLAVWFDWNHDGDFGDANELAVDDPVNWTGAPSTAQLFGFDVPFCKPPPDNNNCDPGKAPLDAPLFYRARLFDRLPTGACAASPSWTGSAINGEVEDYRYDVPTAVNLLWFTATGGKKAITLNWETASELNNLGYNVYRATKIDGERIKVNDKLIPTLVAPGSSFGAVYEWTDTTMRGARAYYYWLESVDLSGGVGLRSDTVHGPVSARAK